MWSALLQSHVKAAEVAAFLQEVTGCPTVVSRCPYAKPTMCTVVMRHPERPKLVKQFFYDFEASDLGQRQITFENTYAGRTMAYAVAEHFGGALYCEETAVIWLGAPPVLPPASEIFGMENTDEKKPVG